MVEERYVEVDENSLLENDETFISQILIFVSSLIVAPILHFFVGYIFMYVFRVSEKYYLFFSISILFLIFLAIESKVFRASVIANIFVIVFLFFWLF